MNVFVHQKRANGKLAREESRDYIVAPGATGAKRKLVKVEGKILDGKNETTYSEAGYKKKDMDIDGGLTDAFARDVMWSKNDVRVQAPVSGVNYFCRSATTISEDQRQLQP